MIRLNTEFVFDNEEKIELYKEEALQNPSSFYWDSTDNLEVPAYDVIAYVAGELGMGINSYLENGLLAALDEWFHDMMSGMIDYIEEHKPMNNLPES